MADLEALFAGPITRRQAEPLAQLIFALADRGRLAIISELAAGPLTVLDLTDRVGLAQPTVSHHLGLLYEAGLVSREKQGVYVWYRLNPDTFTQVAAAITPPGPRKRGRR